MSGFRHEVQPLILIRNLTIFTPNADGLEACENAYILVGFIFRLKCSGQNVRNKLLLCHAISKSRLAAHVNTHLKLSKYIVINQGPVVQKPVSFIIIG
jgi:hypothetical protein